MQQNQGIEDRARESHLQPRRGAQVDDALSSNMWGSGQKLPEGADAGAQKQVHASVLTDDSLGADTTTMYHEHCPQPQADEGVAQTVRGTQAAVEGEGAGDMDPDMPLCKSLAHASYQAPPTDAYLRLKGKEKTKVHPVGTLAPDRDYGLGNVREHRVPGRVCAQEDWGHDSLHSRVAPAPHAARPPVHLATMIAEMLRMLGSVPRLAPLCDEVATSDEY